MDAQFLPTTPFTEVPDVGIAVRGDHPSCVGVAHIWEEQKEAGMSEDCGQRIIHANVRK